MQNSSKHSKEKMKRTLKSLKKAFFRKPSVQWFFASIIAFYVALCWRLGKYKQINAEIPQRFWDKGEPVIISIWHGRLLLIPQTYKAKEGHHLYALSSFHPDGRLVSKAGRFFGIRTVDGSTSKGSISAVKKMIRLAKNGQSLFLTPDGPKGPRQKAQAGIIELARMSGLPIIPVSVSTKQGKQFKRSWDNFLLPSLKDEGVIHWGEPIYIDRKAKKEDLQTRLEEIEAIMNDLQNKADDMMNRPHTKPAETK